MNFFNIIFFSLLIIVIISILTIVLKRKKCQAVGISVLLAIMMIIIIIGIYILDMKNIPTRMGLLINVNTENWFNLINGILGTTIAALVSVNVVLYQIRKDNEKNEVNLRIQNMPLLEYEIETKGNFQKCCVKEENIVYSKFDPNKSSPFELAFNVKNISTNTVKRLYIDFESNVITNSQRVLGEDSRILLEKNQEVYDVIFIMLPKEQEYDMRLVVYYEDILNNWYQQDIEMKYKTTGLNDGSSPIGIVTTEIKEERLLQSNDGGEKING